jgi:acetyl-CoA C-acetyltransferase
LLARHGLTFDDIVLWEIHEAFSAQVACHIRALEDKKYVREKASNISSEASRATA